MRRGGSANLALNRPAQTGGRSAWRGLDRREGGKPEDGVVIKISQS